MSCPNTVQRIVVAVLLFAVLPVAPCMALHGGKIRVGMPTNIPPFAFFDGQLQSTRGFCVDLTLMVGKLMNVQVELYGFDEPDLIEALLRGRIDVVGCAILASAPDSDYQLIDTGIQIDRQLFANKSCLTVTCIKDLPNHRVVSETRPELIYPDFPISSVNMMDAVSAEASLEILDGGGADIYISPNALTTMYQIQKLGLANIKQVGVPTETVPLSLAVLKERASLLSELSLSLGKIQEGEHFQALKKKWFGRDVEIGLFDRYVRYILMAGAGLGLFTLAFAAWNVVLKRRVKTMTEHLVISEQKYRELIESSPDMIHIIAADGRIQMTNQRAQELLETDDMPSTGRYLSELVAPDQKDDVHYFIVSLFENGYGENEFIFTSVDGRPIEVEIVASTLKNDDRNHRIAACFSRDKRVRKSLEEELIRSERLAIMGQMSAGLAHEINNPLGIISSYAQDLLGGELDEETRTDSLNVIAANAERASRIISGLLSFSRHGQPVRTPVDLADILEASLLFVKLEIKRKRVAVHKNYSQIPLVVMGDENQLVQVFVNLLINAIQAVDEKGKIRIRSGITQPDGTEALIEVQDNGPGIKASELEKLFQPFYSTKLTGSGLGLFISNIIVERHNGRIRAESRQGEGTTMQVHLPLDKDIKNISTGKANV
jgi:PAS domain S-box-containing protein